ncbi:MAG TPA: site-specific DNA-methyltransferase [Pseudoalteromonas sp.]|nr:site-specific DNA-methyltransferase [Pseudoalteromonas sp.]|tara:strand:+ start:317 stop:1654 length:1338 start_codon:yes stop_codon:yes gene_type:complete
MATGLNKNEVLSNEAFLAKREIDELAMPDIGEAVSLTYQGKADESKVLSINSGKFKVLNENKTFSSVLEIPDNSYVLADNLYTLSKLYSQGSKVDLIYLDPPYGTGLDFHSRALEHAYKDNMCPAVYLEFMRRRLIFMREVLKDSGSIYVHIGHQMLSHMKVIMDEVFGAKNFQNIITRRKCSSKNFTRKSYSNINDYILFYSKTSDFKWFQPRMKPDAEWLQKEYSKEDSKGRFKLVPVHAPGTRNGATGREWKGKMPPPGKHWQYAPEKLDELDAAGEIHWSKNGNPRRKVYLTNDKTVPYTDYWKDFRDAHHQSIKITGYPTEKNLDMLKLIVQSATEKGDLVIDPFVGSGTTIDAANQLERRWIGMDQSFTSAKTVMRRFKQGLQAMGDYVEKQHINQASLFDSNIDIVSNSTKVNFVVDDYIEKNNSKELTDLMLELHRI